MGRDPASMYGHENHHRFQPTRPHGARRESPVPASMTIRFQPTRPHGARLNDDTYLNDKAEVSTHAPAWGATDYHIIIQSQHYVSTHAPAWGATSHNRLIIIFKYSFNPRARMGRDLIKSLHVNCISGFQPTRPHGARRNLVEAMYLAIKVSTHAPAWGATAY